MSETRPVPRRESPWGLPEGDHRQPKAHRCNDRAEDVIQACFEGNPFSTVPGPFKLFWRCMRSKPGEEPTEPYTYLQLDPPKREEEYAICTLEIAVEENLTVNGIVLATDSFIFK
ncbi:hypothetical protein CMV_009283 [Castanea mollissima]|uniref:Uncharacterized protein n=1 Tax=Castanea mollissima TaxID=60419 RepID=A0A8J4VNA6_9ROSI|nr:hypothetical protein CMV_009283 [Castanea mollissima]